MAARIAPILPSFTSRTMWSMSIHGLTPLSFSCCSNIIAWIRYIRETITYVPSFSPSVVVAVEVVLRRGIFVHVQRASSRVDHQRLGGCSCGPLGRGGGGE